MANQRLRWKLPPCYDRREGAACVLPNLAQNWLHLLFFCFCLNNLGYPNSLIILPLLGKGVLGAGLWWPEMAPWRGCKAGPSTRSRMPNDSTRAGRGPGTAEQHGWRVSLE